MVEPLKKISKKDGPYRRRAEVQAFLEKLDLVDARERTDQLVDAGGELRADAPPEALVHLIRRAWREDDAGSVERLFKALFRRVQASLVASIPDSRMADAETIRGEIVSRFMDRFARDCREGGTWLDYFEVQFEGGFAAYRTTVLRRIGPSTNKTAPLMGDGEHSDATELAPEVEKAAAEFFADGPSFFDDPAFRSALGPAINTLPPDQKAVIGLWLQGIPIDAKDPTTNTIARILKCDERTVRNRRDRAFKALREILEEVKAHAAK
ncbi:MAG TPA: hypothetical protein VHO24_13800 [Opitutaceae bacterium]|nr:hypothetical protein [Opitutaceae bacterium]